MKGTTEPTQYEETAYGENTEYYAEYGSGAGGNGTDPTEFIIGNGTVILGNGTTVNMTGTAANQAGSTYVPPYCHTTCRVILQKYLFNSSDLHSLKRLNKYVSISCIFFLPIWT